MNEDESKHWKQRVDERLVDLTTSARVVADRLDSMDEVLNSLDSALRGSVEGDRHGAMARLEILERASNKYHAILLEDTAGSKTGLCYKVDALISGKMDAVERRKSRASVIIAIITSAALVITNVDRIGDFILKFFIHEPPVKHIKKVRVRRVIDYSEPSPSE